MSSIFLHLFKQNSRFFYCFLNRQRCLPTKPRKQPLFYSSLFFHSFLAGVTGGKKSEIPLHLAKNAPMMLYLQQNSFYQKMQIHHTEQATTWSSHISPLEQKPPMTEKYQTVPPKHLIFTHSYNKVEDFQRRSPVRIIFLNDRSKAILFTAAYEESLQESG